MGVFFSIENWLFWQSWVQPYQLKFNYLWNALYSSDFRWIARQSTNEWMRLSHIKTHIRSNVYRAQPSDQSVILLFSIGNKGTNYLISHLLNCENLMDFKLERHLFMIFPVLFFLCMLVWLHYHMLKSNCKGMEDLQ